MTTTTAITIPQTTKTLHRIERELVRDPRLASDNTRRGYRHDLSQFEAWRGDRPMTKMLVEEYAAELQKAGRSPNSINRALAAVRWWARRIGDMAFEGRLAREDREEIITQAARVASVADVTGEREPKGRHISHGELAALMRACVNDSSPAGVRDAAIIALAWATGARRSELAEQQLSNYVRVGDEEGDLRIHGKGDKVRTVFLYNGAAAALSDWLKLRGDDDGPLFYRILKSGRIVEGEGLSDEALAQMLAKRAEEAGLTEPITWHDFRRTFAGNLLDSGADLVTVQKLMGHSSPTTTSNYDRRGEEVKRKAVRALHVPYQKRN